MQLVWHADTPTLSDLSLLDRDPANAEIDEVAVRAYRLARVREQMTLRGIDACLLFDPVNIRYATGSRNMQVFTARNPARYLFLPLNGPVILFEFTGCEHLADGLETIDEVRPAITASFVAAGPAIAERERLWARATGEVVREHCGAQATVGIERVNAGAAMALGSEGFRIVDAQHPVELARAVKSEEELKCVRASIRATERAVEQLRAAVTPGLTEQQLWSILHQGVIAQGGDYIETRLLSAGERTNPWFQEASDKVIGPNELVALDTDVVGCFGYYCDFSRTFHAGPDKPSAAQQALYKASLEQVHHNTDIIRPGVTFKEYSERAWDIPERYVVNRYYLSAHGVGMTGEYPYLYHRMDYPHAGYDGVIEPNMTICVESYIGEEGGREGVKLEQHCLITDSGVEVLSQFPFEENLMDGSAHGAPDLRLVSGNPEPVGNAAPIDAPKPVEPANAAPRGGITDEPRPQPGRYSPPNRPVNRRAWNTRTPSGSTREGELEMESLTREELIQRTELLLPGPDMTSDNVARLCLQAVECGISSITVPPGSVRNAAAALQDTPARVAAALAANAQQSSRGSSLIRQAVRDGARTIDVVIDVDALKAGHHRSVLVNLRRLVHEARDARSRVTVVLECGRLTEPEQVAAAKLAARVRPDVIATGSGGDGATARQVALIREAAGPHPVIRALLAAGGADAETLIDAGSARLGICGPEATQYLIRSVS